MFLIFDTETTGIISSSLRVIELAWVVCDEHRVVLKQESHLIYPQGFFVPAAATKVNHITNEMLHKDGEPIEGVLEKFAKDVQNVEYIIAHNISFDINALDKEFRLAGIDSPLQSVHQICTMMASVNFCKLAKLNGRQGYKRPKLQELHLRLFSNYFNGSHRALSDAIACKACFFKLVDLGVVQLKQKIYKSPITIQKKSNSYPNQVSKADLHTCIKPNIDSSQSISQITTTNSVDQSSDQEISLRNNKNINDTFSNPKHTQTQKNGKFAYDVFALVILCVSATMLYSSLLELPSPKQTIEKKEFQPNRQDILKSATPQSSLSVLPNNRKLRYLYYHEDMMIGFFDDGSVSYCDKCIFNKSDILKLLSKKPQGIYSFDQGVINPEELIVKNADKSNPFLFWDEKAQSMALTENPNAIKYRKLIPGDMSLPITGDGWALVDYVWKIKPPQY